MGNTGKGLNITLKLFKNYMQSGDLDVQISCTISEFNIAALQNEMLIDLRLFHVTNKKYGV